MDKNNKLISISISYILATFLVKGIAFISTPIFTRLMGATEFGAISNFTVWGQLLSIFMCLEVSSSIILAKLNKNDKDFNKYLNIIMWFSILTGVAISSLIIIFRNPISKIVSLSTNGIIYLCIYALGVCFNNTLSSYCIATEKPKLKIFSSIFSSILILGLGILFVVIFDDKIEARMFGFAIAYAVIILFVFILLLKRPKFSKKEFKSDIRFSLKFSLPLIPHLIANMINGSSDKLMIVHFLGEKANGIYSVVYTIGTLGFIIADACNDAWVPWYYEQSKNNNNEDIKEYANIYAITIAMCFFGVTMLSPEIMKIMATQEYWEGTSCVGYVVLGVFFMFMYRFPVNYEQYRAINWYVAPATIIAALSNVGMNALLIPRLGILGAALATTISYFILWVLHELVARKIIKNYNLSIKNYVVPVLIVLLGFILSRFLLDTMIIRYLIIVFMCCLYLIYIDKKMHIFEKILIFIRKRKLKGE